MSPLESELASETREWRSLMLGPFLGSGTARDVYVWALDPDKVIKIERGARSFQNIVEWTQWQHIRVDLTASRYFAPCHHISANGHYLIQSRVESLEHRPLRKWKGPVWFTDLKTSNLGRLKGRVVACDYGLPRYQSLAPLVIHTIGDP
jgi:hypothetical protein